MKRQYSRNKSKLPMVVFGLVIAAVAGTGIGYLQPWGKPVEAVANTAAHRNDTRRAQLKLVADALAQYETQVGKLPIAIPNSQTGVCAGAATMCKAAGLVDLSFLISKGDIVSLPSDPVGGHDRYASGYTIGRDARGQLVLAAPRAENGAAISETLK